MKFRLIAVIGLCMLAAVASAQNRTVIDKEVGSIYQVPNGFSYSAFGAVAGSPPLNQMDPDALIVRMGRMDKFSPADGNSKYGFPYAAFKSYEAVEVGSGRAPLFVTATYAGKKRPVIFAWSLKLVNNKPTAVSTNWEYAVNVQDPRFIKFWVNRFVRPIMWAPYYSTRAPWFQLDESAFNWNLYGVLDDSNHFVAGVPWDSPFPQNQSAYFSALASFFSQLKTLAPDVKVMPNLGTMSDATKFTSVYANVPGAIHEDIYSWKASFTAYTRSNWYTQIVNNLSWLGAQNRVAILRAMLPAGDSNALVTAFSFYSLVKGPNFFFAPGTSSGNISPTQWARMKALLGNPKSTMVSIQQSGMGTGYRLFWRDFDGGTVYLNWTGVTQTIALSSASQHWDARGNVITKLTIPDGTGAIAMNINQTTPITTPRISPRYASSITSPVQVSLISDTPNTVVRYTLNGTAPTASSTVYSGPFPLSGNAVVTARAFSGSNSSWTSKASYTVSPYLPTAQFALSSDSGSAGTYYPVLVLSGLSGGTVTVTYTVRQATGAITSGTTTFLRGQVYRYFPVSITGSRGGLATVAITHVSGASMGARAALPYTIQ